jgi:hypothetical protein
MALGALRLLAPFRDDERTGDNGDACEGQAYNVRDALTDARNNPMTTRSTTPKRPRKGSGLNVRGFFRVHLVEEDGRISGDSGWVENMVTNLGKKNYLCNPLAGATAALPISFMALGTGSTVLSNDTALLGEISHNTAASRCRVSVQSSSIGSTAVDFYATFSSNSGVGSSYVSTTVVINNVMLINNTTSAGTIFAGSTYGISTLNTNQDVQVSYRITFGP